MINIKNIRELYIASDRFDTFKKSHLKNLVFNFDIIHINYYCIL